MYGFWNTYPERLQSRQASYHCMLTNFCIPLSPLPEIEGANKNMNNHLCADQN